MGCPEWVCLRICIHSYALSVGGPPTCCSPAAPYSSPTTLLSVLTPPVPLPCPFLISSLTHLPLLPPSPPLTASISLKHSRYSVFCEAVKRGRTTCAGQGREGGEMGAVLQKCF